MLAAPARDGSVFQQIFADHWQAFQQAHPRYQTPYYDALVRKMLDNHRRFVRGKRAGKAPIEILTGKELEKTWLDSLLETA
jgi:hypothetical protein